MFTYALDNKTNFVKTKFKDGRMPPKQIISKVLKSFPQVTRAYTLAEYVTFCTDDSKSVAGIKALAEQLANSPAMATFRLYVKSIGGLPVDAIKSLFAHLGDVEDVVILSPRGNPVAIYRGPPF